MPVNTAITLLWAGSAPQTKQPCFSHTVTAVTCADFGPAWLMMEAVAIMEVVLGLVLVRSSQDLWLPRRSI